MILFVQVLASSVCGQGKESYIPPVKQQMDLDKPLPTSNFKIIAILGYWYYTHTHPFNGPLSRTTRVSRYQKGKTSLDFTEARDSEWQWHQLGHIQVCISLQTDNHASTPPLSFLQAGCPSCRPTNSIKALKHMVIGITDIEILGLEDVQGRFCLQSNLLKWIALGPDYEYPLRQSIHLSMFHTLHCVYRDQTNDVHLSGLST